MVHPECLSSFGRLSLDRDPSGASPSLHGCAGKCLGFAQDALSQGYRKFESMIVPVLATLTKKHSSKTSLTAERIAHVLASAVRGFKQTATTSTELRRLIKELLTLSLSFSVT